MRIHLQPGSLLSLTGLTIGLLLIVAIALNAYNIILIRSSSPCLFMPEKISWLEVKYMLISKDSSKGLEVVDKVWINGAPDYANRPFKFLQGSIVTLTAPEQIGNAHFAFWQREEGPTFQGLIITNRTITITLSGPKEIWWANYVIEES